MENYIQTQKYTAINFVPLNFLQQFKKAANLYFLFISIMQCIELISITGGAPMNLPALFFIITVSMIKDGYEDYGRFKRDEEENSALVQRFNPETNTFEPTECKLIKCGDIINVNDDGVIPADIVLLDTTNAKGQCFVETKNLDGETNLKTKSVPK